MASVAHSFNPVSMVVFTMLSLPHMMTDMGWNFAWRLILAFQSRTNPTFRRDHFEITDVVRSRYKYGQVTFFSDLALGQHGFYPFSMVVFALPSLSPVVTHVGKSFAWPFALAFQSYRCKYGKLTFSTFQTLA